MSVFSKSHFIWSEAKSPDRNAFVSFEKAFSFQATGEGAAPVWLYLFADTRFRLWVNEQFVAYGPGRFVTQYPEFDRYDVLRFLHEGKNNVRVEVNFYGASSFQTMPDGKPGMIAAGGDAEGLIDFATPGDWKARVHEAWNQNAPAFSFAQNPAEICDTRTLKCELDDDCRRGGVRVLRGDEVPWLTLEPRSAPYPDYAAYAPSTIEAAGPLAPSKTFGFQNFVAGYQKGRDETVNRGMATWIYSPQEQTVAIGCFWAKYFLNDQSVELSTETELGNHGEVEASLKEGWNLFAAELEVLSESWSFLLRLPEGRGLSAHALPDLACADVFGLSPFTHGPVTLPKKSDREDEFQLPKPWTIENGSLAPLTPARVVAWDTFDGDHKIEGADFSGLSSHNRFHAMAASWSLSFMREFYGQVFLEVEAPEGAILDIAYDDWKRSDGAVNLYGSNPFTDAADRFILRGGRQCIEVLNPRGGIYLQVTIRQPHQGSESDLVLHDVYVRRRTTINEADVVGNIETADADFNYAWRAAVNTLQASTDESYCDCPWRERGAYIGDSLVTVALHQMVSSDLSVGYRAFTKYGQAALPDGQLAGCAPSWLRKAHEDFTYIWILGVYDLWAIEGNRKFVEENWKPLLGIWSAPWDKHESGLWNSSGRRLFIDWGVNQSDREGTANAVINMFRYAALRASADLARVLGKSEESDRFEKEAADVKGALVEHLWDQEKSCFRASLDGEGPALHANILALRFDLAPAESLLAYLKPRLLKNFKQGIEEGQWSGHAELYFLFYVLPKLGELGEIDLAEKMIEQHYGFLRELGFGTLCECFCRAHRAQGSACHVWASAGAIYSHRFVLGLRQTEPGNPNRWTLDPRVSDRFEHAKGALAHRDGPIRVEWKKAAPGKIEALVNAPESVTVESVSDRISIVESSEQ